MHADLLQMDFVRQGSQGEPEVFRRSLLVLSKTVIPYVSQRVVQSALSEQVSSRGIDEHAHFSIQSSWTWVKSLLARNEERLRYI